MSENPLAWQKAAHSIPNGACVEVAPDGDEVLLRNSRDDTVVLRFTSTEMAAFFNGVRNGEFDHLVL